MTFHQKKIIDPKFIDSDLFVIMPFGVKEIGAELMDFDNIYRRVIKPAAQYMRLLPYRVDELLSQTHEDWLPDQWLHELIRSPLVLADLSSVPGSVYYELGIRLGLNQLDLPDLPKTEIVLIADEKSDITTTEANTLKKIYQMSGKQEVLIYPHPVDPSSTRAAIEVVAQGLAPYRHLAKMHSYEYIR